MVLYRSIVELNVTNSAMSWSKHSTQHSSYNSLQGNTVVGNYFNAIFAGQYMDFNNFAQLTKEYRHVFLHL